MRTTPWENLSLQADAAPNDSDKLFTVPDEAQWRLKGLFAELISTATVGNRQLDILIADPDSNPVARFTAGAVQAAGLTRDYLFAPGQPQETIFTNGLMLRALAEELVLPAGYTIRVYDTAAIDPTHDDLTVRLLVEERSE